VLSNGTYAEEVRSEQAQLQQMGIHSVPTFIINQKYAINGGQPVETFVQALTQIQSEQLQTE
jgi:predicted DsbA family dithiol-disulfide isomerase